MMNQLKFKAPPQRQRGMSFIGLLCVAMLVGAAGLLAVEVIPTLIEYQAILKASKKAAQGATPDEVRSLFEKATEIDAITSLTAKDLDITKEGEQVVVGFAYQREIHMFGPAYLTLKYTGRSK